MTVKEMIKYLQRLDREGAGGKEIFITYTFYDNDGVSCECKEEPMIYNCCTEEEVWLSPL